MGDSVTRATFMLIAGCLAAASGCSDSRFDPILRVWGEATAVRTHRQEPVTHTLYLGNDGVGDRGNGECGFECDEATDAKWPDICDNPCLYVATTLEEEGTLLRGSCGPATETDEPNDIRVQLERVDTANHDLTGFSLTIPRMSANQPVAAQVVMLDGGLREDYLSGDPSMGALSECVGTSSPVDGLSAGEYFEGTINVTCFDIPRLELGGPNPGFSINTFISMNVLDCVSAE